MRPNEITDQIVVEMKDFISRYGITPRICLLPRQSHKKLLANMALGNYRRDPSETICGLEIIVTESNSIKVGIV